ncbi:hypothetical protein niasHT_025852 [Heterodera trifolii]|uniref:Uncharacterized protein n=1 Tax=Heterodera trifolii TaxID=157864 RepID=A0ABD2KJ58_9BILA
MENLPENIQNGDCFGILIGPENEGETEGFLLRFAIYVKPMENEYQPSADENPSDDEYNRIVRRIKFNLYSPNLAKVYTVNLGKIDPPELYFNRTIFVDKKTDLANYHALLYAFKHPNRQNVCDYYFLGYAKFTKMNDEEEASILQQLRKETCVSQGMHH